MTVGQARGVALLALAEAGLTVGEYNPRDIKQAVAGYGAADKPQMQGMVRAILNLAEIPRARRCRRRPGRGHLPPALAAPAKC